MFLIFLRIWANPRLMLQTWSLDSSLHFWVLSLLCKWKILIAWRYLTWKPHGYLIRRYFHVKRTGKYQIIRDHFQSMMGLRSFRTWKMKFAMYRIWRADKQKSTFFFFNYLAYDQFYSSRKQKYHCKYVNTTLNHLTIKLLLLLLLKFFENIMALWSFKGR
jgi:hypothetical protein